MLYLENPADTFTAWSGEPINDVRHPRTIEQVWSDEELATIGLYRPASPDPVPEGKVSISQTVQRVDGVVKVVLTLADIVVASEDVNAERDRRVLAGSSFPVTGGPTIPVAGDETTSRNLQGLAFAAQLRIAQGDTTTLTPYRDEANVVHQLVPGQVIELWSQGAAFISAVYQASWVLKDQAPIPTDYKEDDHWP